MAMAIIDGYKVGGVDEPTVADEYNEEREWEVGEFCIYNSTLYKCNTATTGEFDSDSWDVTSCGLEMKGINSNLTQKTTIDISDTRIPSGTAFEEIIQMLAEKVFPKIVNISGQLSHNTQDSYLEYNSTRYYFVGSGLGSITIPNIIKLNYVGGDVWDIVSEINGTGTLTNGSPASFSVVVGTNTRINANTNLSISVISLTLGA